MGTSDLSWLDAPAGGDEAAGGRGSETEADPVPDDRRACRHPRALHPPRRVLSPAVAASRAPDSEAPLDHLHPPRRLPGHNYSVIFVLPFFLRPSILRLHPSTFGADTRCKPTYLFGLRFSVKIRGRHLVRPPVVVVRTSCT